MNYDEMQDILDMVLWDLEMQEKQKQPLKDSYIEPPIREPLTDADQMSEAAQQAIRWRAEHPY